ncbi:PQQ-binding-like beta-propeller repeat protein [Halomicrobium salinisoli]|uniref:outer membrane protein assembly factor BamB family protein n=1 Tax=Halomicrobium salinisoli TaxID=2878391 RepID=UPI003B8A8AD8
MNVGTAATAPALAQRDGEPLAVVGTGSVVVALDGSDGTDVWEEDADRVRGSPAIVDGTVIAGDTAGVVRCLSVGDGEPRWRRELPDGVHGAPAVADESVHVGSRDSHLYALSLTDGATAWSVELPDWVDGSPAVAHGAVFVVDQSGFLSVIVGDE